VLRSGCMPPLASCFTARPETGPGLPGPGDIIALTTPALAAHQPKDWPGGTGQTQLAVSMAQSLGQAGQIDLLIWVTAGSRASILFGYARALAEIAGKPPPGSAEDAAQRLVAWLAQASQHWLVVLDDITDAGHLDGLWPAGPAGRVVLTSRDPSALPGERVTHAFPVGTFSSHEALTYLMSRLATDPDQRIGALDLVDELGREPIALAQASAAIARSALTCRDYGALFARRRDQIAAAVGAPPPARTVTWSLSVEQADELTPRLPVQPGLVLAALLDGRGIPGVVFTTPAAGQFMTASGETDGQLARQDQIRGALLGLERSGLLTIDNASPLVMIRMPAAVQAAVRSAIPDELRDRAAGAAANALLQAWPAEDVQPENPWLTESLRCCAARLQQATSSRAEAGHRLWLEVGRSLDRARLTGPAVDYWRGLAADAERMLGPSHPTTLTATDRLASAALAAGLAAEAVTLFQRTLDTSASTLGQDHPATITAGSDLGRALLSDGRPGEAVPVLERVLAARERGPAPYDLDLLSLRDRLATAYQQAGQSGEAIKLAERTLADRELRQGADDPDTMTTRAALAAACLAGGRLKEAVGHSRRTLADRELVLGADHPDTLAALSALATACHRARRLKEALSLYERALRDSERVLGADHRDTLGARGNLASAYHSANRMATALPLFERSRADCQRVLGACHPDTLTARANLAHAYYKLGRADDAVTLLQSTLADCTRVLPAADPLTTAVRASLDAVSRS
jgi:tetratricopeptide (TPR) repeat protein